MIGSLISEYPGYSLISNRDSARDCFLMIWGFFKRSVSHWFTGWVYANVIIHLSVGESPLYSPPLRWIITRYLLYGIYAWRCARFFFQIQGVFHHFRAFKTEIPHIYSLIGQILKQLSPSLLGPPLRGIIVNYSPRFRRIILNCSTNPFINDGTCSVESTPSAFV